MLPSGIQMGMLLDTISCGLFLSVSTDMTDGMKKMEKTCIIYLALKKKEVNLSSSFYCTTRARNVFRMDGRTDGQIMSNTIVADGLLPLAAKATNKISSSLC